jgi:hypothetical protein
METKNKMNEQLLEAATCEALGANTQQESAAYQQELAAAGESARLTDRSLRETVALMSANSPYMEAPADLRGRILAATAPATFRMEDYRKAMRDNSKFYKWGFYAALAFLSVAAWFNMNTQNELGKAQAALKNVDVHGQVRDAMLSAMVNPETKQVNLMHQGKIAAKAFVDEKSKMAFLIVPEGTVPPGKSLQMAVGGVKFQTVTVTTPPGALTMPKGLNVETAFNVGLLTDDASQMPRKAELGK